MFSRYLIMLLTVAVSLCVFIEPGLAVHNNKGDQRQQLEIVVTRTEQDSSDLRLSADGEQLRFHERQHRHPTDPVIGYRGPKPPQCVDGTLWASHRSNCSYPYNAVKSWIDQNRHQFMELYKAVPVYNHVPQGVFPKKHLNDLCRYVEDYPLVTWAYSYDLGWVPLVQISEHKQYFRLEYCTSDFCSANAVKSTSARCQTSQTRQRVLAWTGHKIVPTTVLLPSSCKCSMMTGFVGDVGQNPAVVSFGQPETPAQQAQQVENSVPERSARTLLPAYVSLPVLRAPDFKPPIYRPHDFQANIAALEPQPQPVIQDQTEFSTCSDKCDYVREPSCCDSCEWGPWCGDSIWRLLPQAERLKRKKSELGAHSSLAPVQKHDQYQTVQQQEIQPQQRDVISDNGCFVCDHSRNPTCCDPCRWGPWCADAVWKHLTEEQRMQRKRAEMNNY